MTALEAGIHFAWWNWWWVGVRRELELQDALIRASGKQRLAK